MSNAIKFTPSGSVQVIARELNRDGRDVFLEFAVIDTGIGIPLDKQGLLFQPFSQIDNSTTRKAGGTGLGLSIVRRLAQLMGGDVRLESEHGKGTRVVVQLKVKTSDAVNHITQIESATAQRMEVLGTDTKNILIVEDTPINALLLRSFLKRLGLNADLVVNGQEAIHYVTAGKKPDIIFMDCQMPVMDGFEATARIRAYEKERGEVQPIPIVALTASAFEEDRNRCMKSGMDEFITKPFNFETLKSVMEKFSPQML